MLKGLLVFISFLFLWLDHNSCSQDSSIYHQIKASYQIRKIDRVPFVKQMDKFCGPASLASVMNYYGKNISQEEIAENVYTPKLNGALISDMENFARNLGYKVETVNGDIDGLISLIDEDIPPIILVDLGKWVISIPHYYVVHGYDKSRDTFLLHTGYKSNQEISFSDLDNQWKRMNRLTLIVRK